MLVYVPLIVYWIIIFILTSLPAATVPTVGISDKIQHFLAYCVLAVLLDLTLSIQSKSTLLKKYPSLFTFSFIFIYGIIDEVHQLLIPGRSGDVMDFLADVIGGIIGILTVRLVLFLIKDRITS